MKKRHALLIEPFDHFAALDRLKQYNPMQLRMLRTKIHVIAGCVFDPFVRCHLGPFGLIFKKGFDKALLQMDYDLLPKFAFRFVVIGNSRDIRARKFSDLADGASRKAMVAENRNRGL